MADVPDASEEEVLEERTSDAHSSGASSEGDAPAAEGSYSLRELNDRVVVWMLFEENVTEEQVRRAHKRWQALHAEEGAPPMLWRLLVENTEVNAEAAYAAAARVYSFEEAGRSKREMLAFISDHFTDFTDEEWQRLVERNVLPVGYEQTPGEAKERLVFVTPDPTRPGTIRLLRKLGHARHELRYVPLSTVEALIREGLERKNEYLERARRNHSGQDLGTGDPAGESVLIDDEQLAAEINSSMLINLFEAMLVEAVRDGVSDIHLFPNDQGQIEIHFRVDGELHEWHVEGRVPPEAFLSVVKDNALGVDRFERDDAQDGSIERTIDNARIRFRVSVLPLASAGQDTRAESIVIRVLDDRRVITDLKDLGLDDLALERFRHAISQPYGMVVLTGPTGSGKTTTLYAALQQVVSPKINVLTVEDPVEYILPDVRQIKIGHTLGIERALRSILRHDPDVVMVGEMRDRPTAELGIKLANTGHLTFSTLHTNDAPSAVSRLYKMGIEPFLLAHAVNLVVAQRLIRTLCPRCRVEATPDPDLLRRMGFSDEEIEETSFLRPSEQDDCPTCKGRGYTGRRAIAEAMLLSEDIRRLIVNADGRINETALREQALEEEMRTLQASARAAVRRGETSVREMMRVVFTQ